MPGSCSRALCECDKQFAQEHSRKEHLWNSEFDGGSYGQFDSEAQCRK